MSTRFATYDEVMGYVRRFTDYERMVKVKPMAPYGVTRMERLLEWLGHPEARFPAVHIAGTKGKGSTAAMVASILRAAGLTVGLYTSPHLLHERERIMIDGRWISEPEVLALVNRMAPYLDLAQRDGETYAPTFFEIYTTLAFLLFAEHEADYGVLETGLGGRLDATNVCRPVVCGITPIGFDHMEKLGNTLDRIAWEKAGIIKEGVPVVCAPQDRRAMNAIVAAAEGRACRLICVGDDVRSTLTRSDAAGCEFGIRTWRGEYQGLRVPLAGEHQVTNAAVAVGLIEVLREQGAPVGPPHVAEGLATLSWHGRIDAVEQQPWLILDSAHNVPSAQALRKTLASAFPCRRRIFVFGIAEDKDVDGVLRTLAPMMDEAVFTKANNPRASDPAALAEKMAGIARIPTSAAPDIAAALERARQSATPNDLICVTGSFYLAGEVQLLLNRATTEKRAVVT